jgi:hypothetical protein
MAFTSYSDIYDPEVLEKLVGEQWLNDPIIVQSGILGRDSRPMQGTQIADVRQKIFQGTSGQALNAGDSISAQKREQEKASMPVLWRYQRMEEPDVIGEIIAKDLQEENANMAGAIKLAAMQYVDDSFRATIEGIGAALTANQNDQSGSAISLANLSNTKKLVLDKVASLDNGAILIHSVKYWALVALGLVAQTSNTYGIDFHNQIVKQGALPTNILGLIPIVTDKLNQAGDSDYYTYLIGKNQLVLRGNTAPTVKVNELDGKMSTEIKFVVSFAVGCDGMKWGASASEKVTDTNLATSGNWTLATNANSNDVTIFRLETD